MTFELDPDGPTSGELAPLIDRFPDLVSPHDFRIGPERNTYRASLAARAVRAYAGDGDDGNEPLETEVCDLLTDLMHLVSLFPGKDPTFDELLSRAQRLQAPEAAGID